MWLEGGLVEVILATTKWWVYHVILVSGLVHESLTIRLAITGIKLLASNRTSGEKFIVSPLLPSSV